MRTLIGYEIKKILMRKVSIVAMALGFLLVVVADIIQIATCEVNLSEGNRLKGLEALKYQSDVEDALTDELTEEFLTDFLVEYQEDLKENETDLDYYTISSASNLYSLIASDYAGFNESWNWEDLNGIKTEGGIGFYEKRDENVRVLLNAEYSYGNYSEQEKEYWTNKTKTVPTPLKWGSKGSWNIIWQSVWSLFFQLMVLSICIVPVFSDEWHLKTDALVLSARYGRTRLVSAKIAGAFLFSVIYMIICGIIGFLINVCIVGIDGWNLQVQLWDILSPYHLNIMQASLLNFCIIILMAMTLTAVSLMLSVIIKNQLAVMSIDILLFYGTVLLPTSKESSLWNHIVCLLPTNIFSLRTVLRSYIDYSFGNVIVSQLEMIWIVYVPIVVLCTYIAGRCFRKCEAGK